MRLYTSINKRLIFAAIYHFLIIIFGGKIMILKKDDWMIYAILRNDVGKEKAEEYKQKCFEKYKKYGFLLKNENNGYNFVKAFGDYDSYTMKCFIPSFLSDTEKEEIYKQIEIPFFIPHTIVPGKNSPPGWIFIESIMGRGFITA